MGARTTNRTYTIMEASQLSGLPESTLRYYETIGLIGLIRRDASSKHRVYSDSDMNLLTLLACLNATGMSIEDMRAYIRNRKQGARAASEQITLLDAQRKYLATEAAYLEQRQQYLQVKIAYWEAIATGNEQQAEAMKVWADAIAKELKIPKKSKTEVRP